jgi:hypothetical protein
MEQIKLATIFIIYRHQIGSSENVDQLRIAIYVPQKYYPNKSHTLTQIYYNMLF